MSDSNEFKQEGGEGSEQYQSGGPMTVNKPTYTVQQSASPSVNPLKGLIEAYKAETQNPNQTQTGAFIEKLNIFMNTIEGEFQTLEEKLRAGGFASSIPLALRLKHEYSKALQQIKHVNSAQQIHTVLLGTIMVNFEHAYDLLCKKESEGRPDNSFIREVIEVKVVAPIEQMIYSEENVLNLYKNDVFAMIYYLTGNCHLKWN